MCVPIVQCGGSVNVVSSKRKLYKVTVVNFVFQRHNSVQYRISAKSVTRFIVICEVGVAVGQPHERGSEGDAYGLCSACPLFDIGPGRRLYRQLFRGFPLTPSNLPHVGSGVLTAVAMKLATFLDKAP